VKKSQPSAPGRRPRACPACDTRHVVRHASAAPAARAIHPRLTLGLLSLQHALIHGQSALYPLVYIAVIAEFGVTPGTVVIVSTIGAILSGLVQYGFGAVARRVSRPTMLAAGGVLTGVATAVQAVTPGFAGFSVANVLSRLGGAPQHPVGNALLADQWPARRIGTAIAVHVAGGNVGTVVVGAVSAAVIIAVGWRGAVAALGVAAVVVAIGILLAVREDRSDDPAPEGPVRTLYRRVLANRDLRWLFATAILGGGSRGLGVLNVFVPLYLSQVVGLDTPTVGAMYAVLLLSSVPGPLVAGWLSDRVGRRPVIVAVYAGGAVSLALFVLAGRDPVSLWAAVVLLSLFSFVESPQLQALLADVTPRPLRDAAFSTYFALAFGVGSFWGIVYGAVTDLGGRGAGLPLVFWIMAGASVLAALATMRIGIPARGEVLEA
jgi:MFS transporter, FSR family, fosmidomycin resistance protein